MLFSVSYFSLLTIIGNMCLALGWHPASSLNTIILIITVSIVAFWFVRKHGRPFSVSEYWQVLLGSILFDLAIQIGITVALLGSAALSGKWVSIAFVLLCHAILLAVGYSSRVVRRYVRAST